MRDHFPARLSIVHMVPAIAARHGVDLDPLFGRVGLEAGAGWTDRIVARARICALLDGLARVTDDPAIGLDLAEAADPRALGPAGLAFVAGRTLGDSLAAHIRQMPALQGGLDYRLDATGRRARLIHRYGGGTPEEARVMAEGVAAFLVLAVRRILGRDDAQLHVVFPHRPRAPARIYEDRLQTAVTFRPGDSIELGFDAALLGRPNTLSAPLAPPGGAPLPRDAAELDDDSLLAALDRVIMAGALDGTLSLPHAAAALGLSPRSLQRRLSALDAPFETRVDGWRRATARHDLAHGGMGVQDIARRLGYADAAHFVRAFHRWEGTTPGAWRRAARRAMT